MKNRQNLIHNFVLSIRDITKEREAETALKEQNEHVHQLQEKLKEILSHDIPTIRRLVAKIETSWTEIETLLFQKSLVVGVYQRLHGWKGAARTLGLKQLAQDIHALESCLDLSTQSLKDPGLAGDAWHILKATLVDYAHLLSNLVESKDPDQARNLFDYAAYR